MCKRCDVKKFDDGEQLLLDKDESIMDLGLLGSIETELVITSPEGNSLINGMDSIWTINAVTTLTIGDNDDFQCSVATIKIKYCPFCGGKLET